MKRCVALFVLSFGLMTSAISQTVCESYICIEADSGAVLAEFKADEQRPPASMVKLMLLFMVSEGIQENRWSLDTTLTITEKTQRMGGSQVYLAAGEQFTVGQLVLAAAVASANDAAMALAEGLWGSEAAYLKAMNARAQELGMIDSEFNSVHGLPPDEGEKPDVTTARDMALLAQWAVRDPLLLEWVGHKEIVMRPGENPKHSTNKLLWRMAECDGLKTGYIRAAGWCFAGTAVRNDIRLITIVMGCSSNRDRFAFTEELLEVGFAEIHRGPVLRKGHQVAAAVTIPNAETLQLVPVAKDDLIITGRKEDLTKVRFVIDAPDMIRAPVTAGEELGVIRAFVEGHLRGETALIAPEDVPEAGWDWKLRQAATPTTTGTG